MELKVNLIAIVAFVIFYLFESSHAGSCAESKLCCSGKDSACVVQKALLNSIVEGLNDKPCYCDHACLKLGDCCNDFKEACGGEFSNPNFSQSFLSLPLLSRYIFKIINFYEIFFQHLKTSFSLPFPL